MDSQKCVLNRELIEELRVYRTKVYTFYLTHDYVNCKHTDGLYMLYGDPVSSSTYSDKNWFITERKKHLITFIYPQEKLE